MNTVRARSLPTNTVRPSHRLRWLTALVVAGALAFAACGSSDEETSAEAGEETAAPAAEESSDEEAGTEEPADADEDAAAGGDDTDAASEEGAGEAGFPVDIDTATGTVTIDAAPSRIVSLSPTATEMLYAIGAGDLVVAVDTYSNFPADVPEGTLDGFAPDLEAILANEPDMVAASGLPDDIAAGLTDNGVTVMILPAAATFDDTFDQIAQLGLATGEVDGAAEANADIRTGIDEIVAGLPEQTDPVRVFHEIDDSFYTATSSSFIGQVYAEMGFENIADPLDDGSGFPLIDGEAVIAADPSLIVFTNQVGYDADKIKARPGWETTTAVSEGAIVQVDADIASRWGPRIVEFMQVIADTVAVPAG